MHRPLTTCAPFPLARSESPDLCLAPDARRKLSAAACASHLAVRFAGAPGPPCTHPAHHPRPSPPPAHAPPCKAAPGPAWASRRFRPSGAQPGERRAIGARGAGRAGPGRARTLGAAHAGPTLRRAGCVAPSPPRYREAAERALCPRARPGLCPEEAAAPSPRLRLCPRAGRAGRGGGSQAEGEGGGGGGLRRRGGQQRRRERRVPGRGSRGLSGRRG